MGPQAGYLPTHLPTIAIIQYTPAAASGDPKPQLTVQWQVPTGLHGISGMAFSDDGKYLVTGGELSGGVKVFQVEASGFLTEVANSTTVDTRTSFVWVSQSNPLFQAGTPGDG
jgi:hypothetical protein